MTTIYLDHNATTPIHPEVKETFIESLDIYGNASSNHPMGFAAREELEKARATLMEFLSASEGRIIFTSGGSESNNLVLKGLVCEGSICPHRRGANARPHVITSAVEHPSVLNTTTCLNRIGADVTVVPVDGHGMIDPDDVKKAIRKTTVMASIMMANNEVGSIQPVVEIGRILRERNVVFHCDAVQGMGKLPVDVDEMNVDYLSVSGHKINAPKGIGALYVRRIMTLCPLIHGGHQELNLRAGTENTPGIIALRRALEIWRRDGSMEIAQVRRLRDRMWNLLSETIDGVSLNGHPEKRLPGTLNVSFDRVDSAAVLEMIGMNGVAASSGSACSSGDESPSHVLTAMNLPPERARSAIRFSLGYGNTEPQIIQAVEIIAEAVRRLRNISPL